jgi:type VI secretion system protein ImpJ
MGKLVLDRSYIPPVLACDAWKILLFNILREIYDRIGTLVDLYANKAIERGIAPEALNGEDLRIITLLRACNESYALLRVLAFAEGVHPMTAYTELCRLVGQLSIFGKERRLPPLELYDHDNLGKCFYRVKRLIYELTEPEEELPEERRFVADNRRRMVVRLESNWLAPVYQMYIAVDTSLSARDCVTLLTDSSQLNMKIGSANRVDVIATGGYPGLRFTLRDQPRRLPARPGRVYFQVDRASEASEWQFAQNALSLAIRINERRVEGDVHPHTVTITHGGKNATLQFTLYVLRPRADEQNK